MTVRSWNGATGNYSNSADWSPAGPPQAGDIAVIDSGKVTIGVSDLVPNLQIQLAPSGAPLVLQTANAALYPTDTLAVTASTIGTSTSLSWLGPLANYGTITVSYGGINPSGASITIGRFNQAGGTLFNFGTISISNTSVLVQGADGAGVDTLVNDGVIRMTGTGGLFTSDQFVVPVTGTGTIEVGAGVISTFTSVGAGQTVTLHGAGAQSAQAIFRGPMAGVVAGLDASSSIDLSTGLYGTRQISSSDGITTVTLLAGDTVVQSVRLEGVFTANQLSISTNASGSTETTTIRGSGTASVSAPASTSLDVYRFFDTVSGTHFFTDDPNEAATVGNTRPDLVNEGVDLHAVNPAAQDPAAVPVYRFFDQIHGTHFFTANAGERDALVASRPDLTYEPGSTFYEDGTPQGGDLAVYRFFDQTNGTHFYSDSASEVTSIAASRPDLVNEGVAFFSPSR